MIARVLPLVALVTLSVHAAQPGSASPLPAKLRDITWGKLNFLHTTDTHGWLAGHLQEPSYSADWGDYISFAARMREIAESRDSDLLVIDTGDRVEGNGLYDASDPKGKYLYDILKQQHIDLLSSGNHELYKKNTSEAEYLITVPSFADSYIASNIDILDPNSGELVPLGPRFRKLTTKKKGYRIMAFGFLFDFTGNYNNTKVQRVEDTVKETWFQQAIRDEDVDLFIVLGHVPVRSIEYEAVHKEIRNVRGNITIQFFGGHFHIRDYARYDAQSSALASGRFMETVGFLSIDDVKSSTPNFSRRYIDNNLFSYYHHTGLNKSTFPTEHGQNVSQMIQEARHALDLDYVHGCAPTDFWVDRTPYPGNNSIYTWLETEVLPQSLQNPSRQGKPALAIVNTGAIRFDIFKGPFTQDSTFIVSPFTSGFKYIKDVPLSTAKRIVTLLNGASKILTTTNEQPHGRYCPLAPPQQCARQASDGVESTTRNPIMPQQHAQAVISDSDVEPFPGYTTIDDAGDDGDDTVHSHISFYQVPNVIQTLIPPLDHSSSGEPTTVDLVYLDFIEPYIALAAKFSGFPVNLPADSALYMDGTMTELIQTWIKKNWKCT
ncbi:Ser/Thr protein phosphatase family [Talaromyces stipitatus ATCC 10500]|uniref:Ser/Thr protein phosphatase family n=1 Tax=Talaromyces stipitatus (strain ATCC 10500 / CBS 375.48 / QM 6759 / NRRL 1006) TaxID=441959 RepID=B8MNW3_TALSN|nr:Ser/Thr protein phosphatase family [Talaromyces stipitatus ATCC 10500]EED14202.1 Ser/Thr protein phosphatase family [Talaromyces stipitatus ATCC 10500]